MLEEKQILKLYRKLHNYRIPRIKFRELDDEYRLIYEREYKVDEHDVNKGNFIIFICCFLIFIFISLFLRINNLLITGFSLIFSLAISYRFNNFLYKKIKNEEAQLNGIIPFIKIYFSLIQSSVHSKSDKTLHFIKLIKEYNLPISKKYKILFNKILIGEDPETLLNNLISPSKDFNNYVKDLVISGFNSEVIQSENSLERSFKIFLRQIESKISIIFFVGLFFPLGFSFLILFQRINTFLLIFFLPFFYLCLRILYRNFIKKDFHLIGMLKDHSKNEKMKYNEFLSFLLAFSHNLKRNISPEKAFASAVSYNNQIGLVKPILQKQVTSLLNFSYSFSDILTNLKNEFNSQRFGLILDVIKGIIKENSFVTHEKIIEILKIIKKHQELEKKLEVIVKGERFKVLLFLFLLPIIIGGIGGLFPIFIAIIRNLEFSFALTSEFNVIFISLLIMIAISSNYFLKLINYEKKTTLMFISCILYILTFFISFFSISNFI